MTRRICILTAGAAVAALALAGCATPVTLDPAPQASAPVCAQLLLTLPETLAGADQRSTTTQASRAWGDPAITLRCGVTPLAPTTDRCISVDDGAGTEVDWVVDELGAQDQDRGTWTFTTYGRVPAVEVVVPVEYAGDDATGVLIEIGASVAPLEQDRTCI